MAGGELDGRTNTHHRGRPALTCTAMRDSRVDTQPLDRMASQSLRRPAMPYTTQVNTREEMIWKGVVAATWGRGGTGVVGGEGQQAVCVRPGWSS